jgi:hypothetical protein
VSNWRDDARERAEPAPESRDEHEPESWRDKPALPEFRHAAPTPIVRPPAQPDELPEEHDANTASRMSVCQLRDRIHGMVATTHAYNTSGGINSSTGRKEKPSEKRARAAKLKAYRAELTTREAREASDAERARLDTAAAATLRTAAAELASPQPARVDPADVPALVQCRRCGLMVAQDSEGDMIGHIAEGQTICPAACDEWTRPRPHHQPTSQAEPRTPTAILEARADEDRAHQRAADEYTAAHSQAAPSPWQQTERDERDRVAAQATDAREADAERDRLAAERAAYDAGVKARKLAQVLSVACRECNRVAGVPCRNYTGANCAPHGVRKADAKHTTADTAPIVATIARSQHARGDALAEIATHASPAAAELSHAMQREATAAEPPDESRARIEAYKADLRAAKAESAARDTRDAAQRAAQVATAAELPPVPPAAAADLERATAKRAAVVAEIRATTQEALSKLDQIVEQLVREHTSGAVIDAAWAAGARIFAPGGKRV